MRVTQGMITEAFIRNLNQNLRRLGKKEDMLASGKRVRLPSDDPVSATLAMRLRDTLLTVEQYTKNAEDAITWLKNTETALANTGDILQRIRELTVYAANDTLSAEDREMVLDEITQLKHQLLQEANASHNKKYLFSGYFTDKAPFYVSADGSIKAIDDFLKPQKVQVLSDSGTGITAGTVDISQLGPNVTVGRYEIIVSGYDGATANIAIKDGSGSLIAQSSGPVNQDIQIGDFYLAFSKYPITGDGTAEIILSQDSTNYNIGRLNNMTVNVPGQEVFSEIFKVVEEIEKAIQSNNAGEISGKLGNLDDAIDIVLKYRSQIGARINRLEATKTRLEYNNIDYTELLSRTEDVDVAKLIMDLKMEENVYRASLAVGARIIQPTLVDFLR
ncbi:flagellar hook-associated protein FlgL [Thermosediminibacter litoriperuensis]|uniref:Flagellar hook-associated protein 3 FlgL n=1 Tax=Thermosediminibacter litoriperuensis TaxID=291989 RepID=A0A5S5AJ53_9FIRM|nr:flagellar hook-associated protein FlgL [Thermosediminibacter litoriperuensis]TYP50915.1 flagellar hook-associated protein 3 FlgL [Thermosediminibacter litoriperuensis]